MGFHALPQGIFPTQGLNPHLLHCRRVCYPLNHLGSPDIWYDFSLNLHWIRALCVTHWHVIDYEPQVCAQSCLTFCDPIAHQAPLSMRFPRQKYWSALPFPTPGDLPDPGIEPISPNVSCIGRCILYHWATWEAHVLDYSGGGLVAKSCPTLAIPWPVACQAPLFMGFSRQEYWSGLPFPSPGDLPDPGIEPGSPASEADSLPTELQGKPHSWL